MIGFEQAMYYLCIYTTRGLFILFADEETQPGGELVQARAGGGPGLPTPHLSSKQHLQRGFWSSVSDKGVLLFTLQACVLAKCFLVIYWRVDEANKENDRVLFFLIHFNIWVLVSWWQLQGSICLSSCTKCWRNDARPGEGAEDREEGGTLDI